MFVSLKERDNMRGTVCVSEGETDGDVWGIKTRNKFSVSSEKLKSFVNSIDSQSTLVIDIESLKLL